MNEATNGKRSGLFNISIDTGVLFAMLVTAVYFGAMLRADLNHAISAITALDEKVTGKNLDMAKDLAELKQRMLVLENRPERSP